jgi:tetratricopeptide (TPR) repeat protein
MKHDLKPPEAPASATASITGNNTQLRLWLLLGFVLIALPLVLLVLPSMVADPIITRPVAMVEEEQRTVAEELQDTTVTDQLRTDAQHALQNFLRLQAHPDLTNAAVWATDGWQRAISRADRGDKEFGQGDFAPALKTYKDAATQLQSILDNREQTLQQNLVAGWQYLQDNAVFDASARFERVIAMQADHQQALLGLERARVRERVLEFVTAAQQAEVSNTLELAVESYTSALQLDPLYLPAQEALEHVESELRNRAFRDSMGRALQAIDNGRFTEAEKALAEAAKINPGDPVVQDTRQRLFSARRQASLGSLRTQAEVLVKKEDWTGAVEKYGLALKIDPQAAFARNGLILAQEKQQLHKQLDHYLNDTTRLYSDDPLNNARKLLAVNQQTATDESLLAEKLATLQQAVKLAVLPVDLLILSDNLTQITIYRVGRLGSFEQKRLSLRPGKYTITGSRQGFRDVLKVIELKPGVNDQSLKIQTEEQI